ncbi:MAG TPA: low-complexity protein [Gammaproteobacteria bacterium]|nr:low-complexity protein [Gammaproteobacteria bacterium]
MSQKTRKPIASAVGAAVAGSMLLAGSATAADNPFGLKELDSGYLQTAAAPMEGKCGGSMKEAKPMEGKCGGNMKPAKPMEGKCGGNMKPAKPMEGKCGGAMKEMPKKGAEGKCGAGKCGGNK